MSLSLSSSYFYTVKNFLEHIYEQYNKPEYIHPDPLEFIYKYKCDRDREIVGLIASSFAYGKVEQILLHVNSVLTRMGNSPYSFLLNTREKELNSLFKDFRYRFISGNELILFLSAIKRVIKEFGALKNCFLAGMNEDKNILIAISDFVSYLTRDIPSKTFYLLPSPDKGSACKRLMLYLRWMVRKDSVDPGCWSDKITPDRLIIPLDTHIYKIARYMEFTDRKSCDMRTAIEITENLKRYSPNDPIKYDFSITRFGIREDLDYNIFADKLRNSKNVIQNSRP